LFDWLLGQPTEAAGWQADLTRLVVGKLTAERAADANAPAATLRIALDAR
jgi:outer membrane lipoprotein LolB